MRCSIEPKGRIYVKEYGFLSLAKNMGTQLNSKYCQKLLDSSKKSTTDAIKRAIQKIEEATGDLIGKKLLIKSQVFLKSLKNHKIIKLMMNQKHQKKDTYLQKKDNKLLMN